MLSDRTLHAVAPTPVEADQVLPASSVFVEVLRKGIRDAGIVAGQINLALVSPDPVLYPGLLAGLTTQQVSQGVAVFDGLSVNVPGPYTLQATCENDQLQETSSSPTTGSLTLWRIYNLPITPIADHMGVWVNFTGSGLPGGIWGKVVEIGNNAILGDYWGIEQPSGATPISVLLTSSTIVTVRYNSVDPLQEPFSILQTGIDAWFAWNPGGGEAVDDVIVEATGQTLLAEVELTVLRHVQISITSIPTVVTAGQTYGVLAVIRNQDGTVAVDINGEDATLEVLDESSAVVYSATVPVVNGNVFTTLTMPGTAGPYTVRIRYQGTWYLAEETEDEKALLVNEDAEEPEEPGPEPVVGEFPPEHYEMAAGGCPLEFEYSPYLELGASDDYIEVTTR